MSCDQSPEVPEGLTCSWDHYLGQMGGGIRNIQPYGGIVRGNERRDLGGRELSEGASARGVLGRRTYQQNKKQTQAERGAGEDPCARPRTRVCAHEVRDTSRAGKWQSSVFG